MLYRHWREVWWPKRLRGKKPIEKSTQDREMDIILRFIAPRWDEVPLNQICRGDIQEWAWDLEEDPRRLAPKTVARTVHLFRTSLIAAVVEEVLDANPYVKIEIAAPTETVRDKYIMSAEVEAKLMARLGPEYAMAVYITRRTGMRTGELGGFHRHRIDYREGSISIIENLVYLKAIKDVRDKPHVFIKAYTKNGKKRKVPLAGEVADLVKLWCERYPGRPTCGLPHEPYGQCGSDLLVRTPRTQEAIKNQVFSNVLGRACAALELNPYTPYSARRGFQESMRLAGVDAHSIALMMGHADIKQGLTYSPELTSEAMAQARLALEGGAEPAKLKLVRGGQLEVLPDPDVAKLVHSGQSAGTSAGTRDDSQALTSARSLLLRHLA